jgi:hypothetical protein
VTRDEVLAYAADVRKGLDTIEGREDAAPEVAAQDTKWLIARCRYLVAHMEQWP